MRKAVPLLLVAMLLSGFRAFPSLSEPDPRVVFDQFQSALSQAEHVDDFAKYLSRRKAREYEHKAAEPGGEDKLVETLRENFYLMHAQIAAQDISKDTAILVYKGAVNLNGNDYVPVTMGVLLVKEDGAWKVDRDKITYTITTERDGETHTEPGRMAM